MAQSNKQSATGELIAQTLNNLQELAKRVNVQHPNGSTSGTTTVRLSDGTEVILNEDNIVSAMVNHGDDIPVGYKAVRASLPGKVYHVKQVTEGKSTGRVITIGDTEVSETLVTGLGDGLIALQGIAGEVNLSSLVELRKLGSDFARSLTGRKARTVKTK